MNSLCKAELIYGPEQGTWKTVADVEFATLAWVHCFNTQRLHGYLDDIPPADCEDIYHNQAVAQLSQVSQLHQTQGDSTNHRGPVTGELMRAEANVVGVVGCSEVSVGRTSPDLSPG